MTLRHWIIGFRIFRVACFPYVTEERNPPLHLFDNLKSCIALDGFITTLYSATDSSPVGVRLPDCIIWCCSIVNCVRLCRGYNPTPRQQLKLPKWV
jgi:hypothetical protein